MKCFNNQVRFFCIAVFLALQVVPQQPLLADLDSALNAVKNEDYFQAYQEFKKLADEGNREAQYNLAMLYKDGKGVLENKQTAAEWFRKSADAGLSEAEFQLGRAYDKGEGVAQSNEYAVLWYRKSAEHGNPWAQANLGVMYAEGQGIKQDLVLAYVWFNLAASQGVETAFDNREIIAQQMSEEMLTKVREISRTYFGRYVEPYLSHNTPNLRKGMPVHKHPGESQDLPAGHPIAKPGEPTSR